MNPAPAAPLEAAPRWPQDSRLSAPWNHGAVACPRSPSVAWLRRMGYAARHGAGAPVTNPAPRSDGWLLGWHQGGASFFGEVAAATDARRRAWIRV